MSTIVISNIKATGETASRAVSGVAAAWVNFDGTSTITIRGSQGVSGLVDDGAGNYRVNLTNAMGNANYSYVGSAGYNTAGSNDVNFTASNGSANMGASVFGVRVDISATNTDVPLVCASAHGDLA
jgi:hypothetical protein